MTQPPIVIDLKQAFNFSKTGAQFCVKFLATGSSTPIPPTKCFDYPLGTSQAVIDGMNVSALTYILLAGLALHALKYVEKYKQVPSKDVIVEAGKAIFKQLPFHLISPPQSAWTVQNEAKNGVFPVDDNLSKDIIQPIVKHYYKSHFMMLLLFILIVLLIIGFTIYYIRKQEQRGSIFSTRRRSSSIF